jgi:hypothetical protein
VGKHLLYLDITFVGIVLDFAKLIPQERRIIIYLNVHMRIYMYIASNIQMYIVLTSYNMIGQY